MVIRPLDDPHDVVNLWSLICHPSVLGMWGRRRAHSVAPAWIPISSPLTQMVYLLPFLSYLAGSKSVSVRPPDLDTMRNTVLEAIASPSGKTVSTSVITTPRDTAYTSSCVVVPMFPNQIEGIQQFAVSMHDNVFI